MPNNVKNTTFVGPFDLLFPHSCRGCGHLGEPLCDRCKNYILKSHETICPNCKKSSKNCHCKNLPPIYIVAKKSSLLGDVIKDYKYHSIRALARPLAELLAASLPEDLPKDSIIVPLPTATHHLRSRGFDHTKLIAKHLSRLRHLPMQPILERSKNTVQVGSDRSARLSQADSAYSLKPNVKIDKDATYILLDDIWTTGASILAATNKLKKAGAEHVVAGLLAYSD